jgi:hypothetical protein
MLHDLSPSGFGRAALALLAVHLVGCLRLAWELWQRPRIGTGVALQAR